jgi:hypothetical protein
MPEVANDLVTAMRESLAGGNCLGLVLTRPVRSAVEQPRRQSLRRIVIRNSPMWQWELQFDRQQTHLNLDDAGTMARVGELLGAVYREARLFTTTCDLVAHAGPNGLKVRRLPPSRKPQLEVLDHNRQKNYLIPEGVPCEFLIKLGVMTAQGQVKQPRQKKFRQINRYLEFVRDVVPSLPETGTLKIVDFGCGLSYLTFALHHFFTVLCGREIDLLGIDQNEQVVNRCRTLAGQLGLQGIRFSSQRIENAGPGAVDLAVSLHACDTATDAALGWSVRAGASVILAAPCCQHELATQVHAPQLDVLLRHGILKERFSSLATDALRASALEAAGYRTQVLEFIDLEHTPKNLLLRAVRREDSMRKAAALEEYQLWKAWLGCGSLATDMVLPTGE